MNIFGIGLPEMAVIAAIGLLVFGPKRLPELGRTLGRTLKGFQSASSEFEKEFRTAIATAETVSKETVTNETAANETAANETLAAETVSTEPVNPMLVEASAEPAQPVSASVEGSAESPDAGTPAG